MFHILRSLFLLGGRHVFREKQISMETARPRQHVIFMQMFTMSVHVSQCRCCLVPWRQRREARTRQIWDYRAPCPIAPRDRRGTPSLRQYGNNKFHKSYMQTPKKL